jgi:hypothetical protein
MCGIAFAVAMESMPAGPLLLFSVRISCLTEHTYAHVMQDSKVCTHAWGAVTERSKWVP